MERFTTLLIDPTSELSLESLELSSGKLRWNRQAPQVEYHLHSRNTLLRGHHPPTKNIFVAYAGNTPTSSVLIIPVTNSDLRILGHGNRSVVRASPRIHGEVVLLFNSQQADQLRPGQTPGVSRIIALDRNSGQDVTETELIPLGRVMGCLPFTRRQTPSGDKCQHGGWNVWLGPEDRKALNLSL